MVCRGHSNGLGSNEAKTSLVVSGIAVDISDTSRPNNHDCSFYLFITRPSGHCYACHALGEWRVCAQSSARVTEIQGHIPAQFGWVVMPKHDKLAKIIVAPHVSSLNGLEEGAVVADVWALVRTIHDESLLLEPALFNHSTD
jgi:hypothetical protein